MKAGQLSISADLILEWLQFEGGNIRKAEYNPSTKNIDLIITDHDELPEIQEGGEPEMINPSYTTRLVRTKQGFQRQPLSQKPKNVTINAPTAHAYIKTE